MNGTNLHIALNNSSGLRLNLVGGAAEHIRMVSPASTSFSGKISINTTQEWLLKPTYVPVKGEIVIFSDRNIINGICYPGIKIGDGNAYVVDLPFFGDNDTDYIVGLINNHIDDVLSHVSAEDRSFWDAKLNYEVNGENLTFTRN